ncbi:SsrA-binding protein SmpB [bacterium]|nr:SsrA-binding protein SmpB [bacterium]
MKPIVNKRAYFDYEILEKYEAGIELLGNEVKSIKKGQVSLKGSFVIIKKDEVYLLNAHISPYQVKNTPSNYNPFRTRRLLLHKSEIKGLIGKVKQKGLTLVPLKLYTKGGRIKIEIGLARARKKVDKREKIKEREIKREMERVLKNEI